MWKFVFSVRHSSVIYHLFDLFIRVFSGLTFQLGVKPEVFLNCHTATHNRR